MSVILFHPAAAAATEAQQRHAKAILTQPQDYAHRPHIFRAAWAALKLQRGQIIIQSRLRPEYLIGSAGDAA